MGTVTDAQKYDVDELTAEAVESLNRASEDLVAWCYEVKVPNKLWPFRWAKDSLRVANMVACNYILGIPDQCVWTGKCRQRKEYDTSIYIEVGKELMNQ